MEWLHDRLLAIRACFIFVSILSIGVSSQVYNTNRTFYHWNTQRPPPRAVYPGSQGLVYGGYPGAPAQNDGPRPAATRRVSGINTCGNRFERRCCNGWLQPPGSPRCSIPLCSGNCGPGTCMRPNLCMCPDGQMSSSCTGPSGEVSPTESPESTCAVNCLNGGTCSGNRCECRLGFTGPYCGQPLCQDGCQNGGRCMGPGRCVCVHGYAGSRCNIDYRTGPCFTQLTDNTCHGQLTGVVCTKRLCCATLGKAWGNPCEQCPETPAPCRRGYMYNPRDQKCHDVNECQAIPGLCAGAKCTNTPGSYNCQCEEGRRQDPVSQVCVDIDECAEDQDVCGFGNICTNTDGGYSCTCSGRTVPSSDGKSCVAAGQGRCFTDETCSTPLTQLLSFRECCCSSGKGWAGLGEPLCKLCPLDVSCKEDWVDNCDRSGIPCTNGRCVYTDNAYSCECDPGYTLNAFDNCVDVDECNIAGKCYHGRCNNTDGSYICICDYGYTLSTDGTYCTDMDECKMGEMCPNGDCVNMNGSYTCDCLEGFEQSPNQQACFDIDECAEIRRICGSGQCTNTPGSYTCHCDTGYRPSPDGTDCYDIDECAASDTCRNGQCVNTIGGYECLCNPGFVSPPNEQVCIDVNECDLIEDRCVNAECINTHGDFRCECYQGYELGPDGTTCSDTRKDLCYTSIRDGECFNPSNMVVTKSTCCCSMMNMNPIGLGWGGNTCMPCPDPDRSPGEYDRLCPDDMVPDMNECAFNPNACEHGKCEDLEVGFICDCDPGFTLDATGRLCLDINECAIDHRLCDGGTCRNTPGSFRCSCPTGYEANNNTGFACEDIDECASTDGIFSQDKCTDGRCINTPGSFRCECQIPGMSLDASGHACIDVRKSACWSTINGDRCEEELSMAITRQECCSTIGKAWGVPCEPCPPTDNQCYPGFVPEGGRCVDVNECYIYSNICTGGGTCINTEGSFRCQCPLGLTLDSTGRYCQDMREGTCYAHYHRGLCRTPMLGNQRKASCCCTIGAAWGEDCSPCPSKNTDEYQQLCPNTGMMCENNMCEDLNECQIFPMLCANGNCRNIMGSFACLCNQGYAKDPTSTTCIDIDECTIARGACGNGTCINTPGRFECDCDIGFESTMMMQTCMDIDECRRDPTLCGGGHCVNTIGSYACRCAEGFELMPGGKACKDIDECNTTSGICTNGVCENFMGAYECICDSGFKPNPLKSACTDIDECRVNNGGCMVTCINTPGSFNCDCRSGQKLLPDQVSCGDIDECVDLPDVCSGGTCTNLPGTFRCACADGLITSSDRRTCSDIDECALNRNLCMNGLCKNTHGSFICDCEFGYSVKEGSGGGCTDEDECNLETNLCDQNARCINTVGSYKCECNVGFSGDGYTCRDTDECLRDNGGCSLNAACINIPGTFHCVCDEGFDGDGYSCIDVDECSLDSSLCENGQCLNYPGGYRCECDMGFISKDNDHACEDIDECELPILCVNGRCVNVYGMFRCECYQGYTLDITGGNCTDINECENPGNCFFGTCINQQGSYVCQCPPHFELNPTGTGCIDQRRGKCFLNVPPYSRRGACSMEIGSNTAKTTCCCAAGRGWGETAGTCEVCPEIGTVAYENLCPGGPGFSPSNLTVIMEDTDECALLPGICRGGNCTNSFGSFLCTCPSGFTLDEATRTCVDVNECAFNTAICGVGTCVNVEGSYDCICPEGHMLMPDKNCMDMRKGNCYRTYYRDFCENPLSSNLTNKQCCCTLGAGWNALEDTNVISCHRCPRLNSAAYRRLCGAEPGQITDPETGGHVDLNECTLIPNICLNGECINTAGSFKCQCPPGFRFIENLLVCEDINECREGQSPCVGNAECVNTLGSFLCQCPVGYILTRNQRVCRDKNECVEEENVCAHGRCDNLMGSYTCDCDPGFRISQNRDTCIDIDECRDEPMCINGLCQNTEGSYVCTCNPGYALSRPGRCRDIDECRLSDVNYCQYGRCQNEIGSFVCICHNGFELNTARDQCVDINECDVLDRVCENGICNNIPGSYVCTCNEGFRLSRSRETCQDKDECEENPGICRFGTCQNTPGGFECICPPGFELAQSGRDCIGMRVAECYDGFENDACTRPRPSLVTRATCCCSKGLAWREAEVCAICPMEHSTNFRKLCPQGMGYILGLEMEMEDINECSNYRDVCVNGRCINMDGSFRCQCPPGFVLSPNRTQCIDEDECSRVNICGRGTCVNTIGSFECSCNRGYSPSPEDGSCSDKDECLDGTHNCAYRCHNTLGTFRCTCPKGFQLAADGIHCEDVDECATSANNCPYECKNLVGMFMCICPVGYRQVGNTDECLDIDECSTIDGICPNGQCINLDGTYRCECYGQFRPSPDRLTCYDYRESVCYRSTVSGRCVNSGLPIEMTKAVCCCMGSAAWGLQCEACPRQTDPEFDLLCANGNGQTPDGDIDECKYMPTACTNGRCVNTMGSYRCLCDNGYKVAMSGSECVDVDECALPSQPCQFDCTNTIGSYQCSCPDGYVITGDGRECRDVDECRTGNNLCQHSCVNTVGSYECGCGDGYIKQNGQCIDMNECSRQPPPCQQPATCTNTEGSYMCECPEGFKADASGACQDMDECEDDYMCQYSCQNMMGGYRCECPMGFVQHYYWNTCVDQNECMGMGVCGSASCYNTIGGYMCQCGGRRLFDPMSMGCVGMGGGGCGGAPCNFGCAGTQAGFMCSCPDGFQRIGQGHCVSAISPPGAGVPPGMDLPHLPYVGGDTTLPNGEVCYSCNVDQGGIPLEVPIQNLMHIRYKRSAEEEDYEAAVVQDAEAVILDVSGPHAQTPSNMADMEKNITDEHHVLLHLTQLLGGSVMEAGKATPTSPPPATEAKLNQWDEDDDVTWGDGGSLEHTEEEVLKRSNRTMDLHPADSLVLYIWRQHTAPNRKVLKLLPSLAALKDNEVCSLAEGDETYFGLKENKGMNSLYFKKEITRKSIHKLKLICRAIHSVQPTSSEHDVTLDEFDIKLELFIL